MTGQIRILLIDDDPFQLQLTSHLLRQIGFTQATCFWGAREALRAIADPQMVYDVILLDLNMPEMDGLEFLQRLRETNFSGSLVLLSGQEERILDSAVKLASAYRLNVLGYLKKPVTRQQLAHILSERDLRRRNEVSVVKRRTYSPERLKAALDNNELFNVYQPKVSLDSGKLVSVEALVRWRHPEDGIVMPGEFIAVAEDNDLIDALGRAVLASALNQLREWKRAGLEIGIAVNISMGNLTNRTFLSDLEALLTEAQIRPEELTLEVTESRLMQDYATVLDILTRLRMRRVNLSIDDFGTGHSSMAQLRDIPFNELKIDRGFVHGAGKNETLRAIFKSSVQLANNLGIQTVAEGVEDLEDWKFLTDSGCDVAQGYLISRPIESPLLADWQRTWQGDYAKL